MVQSLMYCAEQIVIPDKLPDILKTYAKAAIRTQPYDLLRWSAAYFRCMAMNLPPPVKARLEKESRFGSLTKGYLRILLEQVGKGFYIRREVLQTIWKSLSLPEDELLNFLSLCRMLHWSQIHWLKLFAVMVGSLNDDFKTSVEMICELLTNEPEKAANSIPLWMFKECYTFIAELDCSVEQHFVDGRRVLDNGDLEQPNEMPSVPAIPFIDSFLNTIFDHFNPIDKPKQYPHEPLKIFPSDCPESGMMPANSLDKVDPNFKFIDDLRDSNRIVKRTTDYNGIILLLNEAADQNCESSLDKITQEDIEKAIERQQKVEDKREKQAEAIEKQVNEHTELLKNIKQPWSWIHQFGSQSNRSKSYNFIEFNSVPSDRTPAESSDESYDFDREHFKSARSSTVTIDSLESLSSSDGSKSVILNSATNKKENIEDEVSTIIIKKCDEFSEKIPIKQQSLELSNLIDGFISDVLEKVCKAENDGELEMQNTPSIRSFLEKQPSTEDHEFNLKSLITFLQEAENQNMVFKNLNDLQDYLKQKFDIADEISDEIPVSDKNLSVDVVAETERKLIDKFDDCNIEIDQKIVEKKISDNMILGLVESSESKSEAQSISDDSNFIKSLQESNSKNFETSAKSETTIRTSASAISNLASGISSISSRNFAEHVSDSTEREKDPFKCTIPAFSGIGKALSTKTIRCFLEYLQKRSLEQNGMIYSRNFAESKCPNMYDCFEC